MRFLMLVLLVLAGPGCARELGAKTAGAYALNKGDAAEAYRLWLPLARSGDPEVQEAIALILVSDAELKVARTREDREREALGWVAASAASGYQSSMVWLADAYKHGFLGLKRDAAASKCWAEAAKSPSRRVRCKRPQAIVSAGR